MKNTISKAEINRLVTLAPETIAEMSYEEKMATLELVIEAMEQEGTPLELGNKLYFIGNTLSQICAKTLDDTEAKMIQLLGDVQSAKEQLFDPEKDGR